LTLLFSIHHPVSFLNASFFLNVLIFKDEIIIIPFQTPFCVLINFAMGQIICVASQKGGTGKTTTAVNLAASLALLERQVLLVDCDPLGNATTGIGIDKGKLSCDLFDALVGRVYPRDILVESSLDCLQVLPARIGLHHAEKRLGTRPEPERYMRDVVREVSNDYEFTIIDSPPSFGFLTKSALASSDFLLLPLQHQIFSFEGLSQLLVMVRGIQKKLNPLLKIAGIFYTMCRNDSFKGQLFDAEDLHQFRDKLFSTVIPWDDTLSEASDLTRPVALLDIMSKGAVAYMQLAQELMAVLARN
jgi:chromosome partitioning protein